MATQEQKTTVNQDIPSLARLVERLDADTGTGDERQICDAVRETLVEEIVEGKLNLPPAMIRASETGYARRLLHRGDDYTVVVMVWGPGQGTPIHDHDGKWCVECVYQGQIHVVSYDIKGSPEDEIVSFQVEDDIAAGRGEAGALIPPYDYHIIENLREDVAVTVHVYGGEIARCTTYSPVDGNGTYRREERELGYNV